MSDRTIVVEPATPDRWPDVATIFATHGEGGCWCQYWRQSSSAYSRSGSGSGEANLRAQVARSATPGMVAYLHGESAGWLGFWPRGRLERLVRSRTIPKVDDTPVWSIVCFMIRVGFRRQGLAHALLTGAIDYARAAGVPGLEAYPIDPQGKRIDVSFGYVGFTPMFEAAGFHRITETDARSAGRPRILMRLDLARVGKGKRANR